jgi:hypothetical protein
MINTRFFCQVCTNIYSLQQQEHHPSGGTPSSRGHQSTEGAHGTQRLPPCGGLAVNSSCSSQIGMPPDCADSSKGQWGGLQPDHGNTHSQSS